MPGCRRVTAAGWTETGFLLARLAIDPHTRRYPSSDEVEVTVGWDQVASWRVAYVCCWSGGEMPALDQVEYATRECPGDIKEGVFRP